MIRTSLTHPLAIAELPVGERGGAIGVTFAPGKYQEVAMTGAWARHRCGCLCDSALGSQPPDYATRAVGVQ